MNPHPSSSCKHCGSPVPEGAPEPDFCCRGCAHVHDLIHDQGLDQFYDLKGRELLAPVKDKAFAAADWTWLEQRVAAAEAAAPADPDGGAGVARIETGIDGVSCIGCLWLIEKLFTRHPGGLACETHPGSGWLRLSWRVGQCDLPAFAHALQQFGYLMTPQPRAGAGRSEASDLRLRLGLCSAFAMNAMAFTLPSYLGMERDFFLAGLFEQITALSATLALAVGGSYFIKRALAALRHGLLHMDFPIALGVTLAWLGSMVGWLRGHDALIYFDFVAIFLCLMLGGRLLQVAALERHRQRARGLESVPREATLADGTHKPLQEVAPGDLLAIEPGSPAPVGGILRETTGSVSLEWINGEPEPQVWNAGRRVPAGAINLGRHPLRVEAAETWDDSLLKRLAEADGHKVERRPLMEVVLRWYVIVVLALAVIGGGAWLAVGAGWVAALQVTISVLVVSCPCAIGLALPLADDLARAALQRRGIFLRRADFFPRLAGVRTVVFDKTGTLTMERPELRNPEALEALAPEARERLRRLVGASLHPVSRRLLESLAGPPADHRDQVEEIPGMGLRLRDRDGSCWTLGQPAFATDHAGSARVGDEGVEGDEGDEATSADTPDWADTVLRCDGNLIASFSFHDSLRPESREAVDWLRARGFDIAVLSGDRPDKVARVARDLALPPGAAHSRLSPAAKRAWLEARDPDRRHTLFLGDGANDSFACAAAACVGTPLVDRALLEEKADFFFTGRGLGFLPVLFRTAAVRRRAVRRAFAFAVTYNAAAITACLAGLMHPLVAAIIMPLGSLISVGRVALAFKAGRPRSAAPPATINALVHGPQPAP